MINNKRGVVRIIEAAISITLIAIVMLLLYPTSTNESSTEAIESVILTGNSILEQLANNHALREEIITNNGSESISNAMRGFIDNQMKTGLDYELRVCELRSICNPTEIHEEVYATERVVSSTLEEYNPKKVKLFMWPKTS